jgi:hypothetical protein
MHSAWLEHGPDVIDRLIAERPEIFLMAMLKIAQVHRVEIGQPEEFGQPSSKEEVDPGRKVEAAGVRDRQPEFFYKAYLASTPSTT